MWWKGRHLKRDAVLKGQGRQGEGGRRGGRGRREGEDEGVRDPPPAYVEVPSAASSGS
jgi:hypothetical protein